MTLNQYKQEAMSRAMFARDWAKRQNDAKLEIEMIDLLSFIEGKNFDMRELLWKESYKTAIKIWNR